MMSERGTLVNWIDDKGFGFIKPDHGNMHLFIHVSALKGMSRRPVKGDVIHYQVSLDANGKARAVNARIEGVSQELVLVPLARNYQTALPAPAKARPYRPASSARAGTPRKRLNRFSVLIYIAVAVVIYSKISKEHTVSAPAVATSPVEQAYEAPEVQTEQFQCQGKVWCSEMTSYEEAVFYLHHCPGTKMDGDGDGEPCERQFE